MAQIGAVSSSLLGATVGATQWTGSFHKILSLGSDDDECTLERIEFGRMTTPESDFTPSNIVGPIKVPAGTYIEGPIGRFSASIGGFLAYFEE